MAQHPKDHTAVAVCTERASRALKDFNGEEAERLSEDGRPVRSSPASERRGGLQGTECRGPYPSVSSSAVRSSIAYAVSCIARRVAA